MKIRVPGNRLWLCLPIVITDLIDLTVTLLGQPAAYWQGSYELVNEFNPLARGLMLIHPLGAVAYILLDMAAIALLIVVLPSFLAKVLSAFWAIGSAKAIYNWLVGPLQMGWWISNLFILIPTTILVLAFDQASKDHTGPDASYPASSIPELWKRG